MGGIASLADCGTGNVHITVDLARQNAITIVQAANSRGPSTMLQRAEDKLAGASVMLVQMKIPLDVLHSTLELGRRAGDRRRRCCR